MICSEASLTYHRCVWRTPSLLSWVCDADFWSFLSLRCQLRHSEKTCSFRDVPLASWSLMLEMATGQVVVVTSVALAAHWENFATPCSYIISLDWP